MIVNFQYCFKMLSSKGQLQFFLRQWGLRSFASLLLLKMSCIFVGEPYPVYIYPYLPSGLFHLYQLDESISIFRGVWCTFLIFNRFLKDIPVSKQCTLSAASDLGLHCLHMSKKWYASLIWVKLITKRFNKKLISKNLLKVLVKRDSKHWQTVKILRVRTPKTIAVITLKCEKGSFKMG